MGGHLEPSTSWRRPSRRVLGSSWKHLVLWEHVQRATPLRGSLARPLKIIYIAVILVSSGSFWMAKKLPKPYAQNNPKIIENSSSRPQKSIPKLPKIEPKAVQNRGLEGIPLEIVFPSQMEPLIFHSWGRFGGVLGASWGHLGAVLGALGRLGGVLGPH